MCSFELPCPIRDVKLAPISQKLELEGRSYEEQSLGGYVLYYFNDWDLTQVLTGVEVSIADRPCLNSNQRPQRPNNNAYPLMVQTEVGCGEYGPDYDTNVVDSDEESLTTEQIICSMQFKSYLCSAIISQATDSI